MHEQIPSPEHPNSNAAPRPLSSRWRSAKVRWAVLLWAIGVPLPLVLLFVLIRGC